MYAVLIETSFFQPGIINRDSIEYSLKETGTVSPEPNEDEEQDEDILRSSELGSVHSLNLMHKTASINSLKRDTPQSIPLADLENELKLSELSLMSTKSYQSIKSYNGSIKVKVIEFFRQAEINSISNFRPSMLS